MGRIEPMRDILAWVVLALFFGGLGSVMPPRIVATVAYALSIVTLVTAWMLIFGKRQEAHLFLIFIGSLVCIVSLISGQMLF
jgi:hypothetical protein